MVRTRPRRSGRADEIRPRRRRQRRQARAPARRRSRPTGRRPRRRRGRRMPCASWPTQRLPSSCVASTHERCPRAPRALERRSCRRWRRRRPYLVFDELLRPVEGLVPVLRDAIEARARFLESPCLEPPNSARAPRRAPVTSPARWNERCVLEAHGSNVPEHRPAGRPQDPSDEPLGFEAHRPRQRDGARRASDVDGLDRVRSGPDSGAPLSARASERPRVSSDRQARRLAHRLRANQPQHGQARRLERRRKGLRDREGPIGAHGRRRLRERQRAGVSNDRDPGLRQGGRDRAGVLRFDPTRSRRTGAGARRTASSAMLSRRGGSPRFGLVVLRTRQHLAAVLVEGDVLVLELLRFAHELRPLREALGGGATPAEPRATPREAALAGQLIDCMAAPLGPRPVQGSGTGAILLEAIHRKAETGAVEPRHEPAEPPRGAINLASLLEKSVAGARASRASKKPKKHTGRSRAA